MRRRLHGRRGLKCHVGSVHSSADSRRLHGRRGLKYPDYDNTVKTEPVAAFTGGVD